MKTLMYLLIVLSGVVLFGCGRVPHEIRVKSIDERTNVFREVSDGGNMPSDSVDLIIKAQIKTDLKGFYILESKDSLHGNPAYPFLLNIDGQHVVWQMVGHEEHTSFYDKEGGKTIDGGPGMRYLLEKRIRLAAGPHRIFVALPGDNYYKEFEVTLKKDMVNMVELIPVYLQDNWRRPTYLRGIEDFKIVLNSAPLTRNP